NSTAAAARSLCRIPLTRVSFFYEWKFVVDPWPANAGGGGGMGDLSANSFSDRARTGRAGVRNSDRWFIAAGGTPGRSRQSQTHHSRLANFQLDLLGIACARFVATSQHSAMVDLALLQSWPGRHRECVSAACA